MFAIRLNQLLPLLTVILSSALPMHAVQAETTDRHECLIEPRVITQLGSSVQGVVEKLLVDRGEFVKRGQAVAKLAADIERINLDQAEARANMKSEIVAREADLVLAKHNHARMQELFDQNMVSAQQRDEAIAQRHVASAALVQALESFQLLQIEKIRAEQQLAQRTIRSPIDGVVVEHSVFPGEFVYDNPVMTIAQIDPLRVEVVLPGRLFGDFKEGDTALVYPELGATDPLVARIEVVDKLLDTRSGTFGVRLTLPNAEHAIAGGQKCQLEFAQANTLASR